MQVRINKFVVYSYYRMRINFFFTLSRGKKHLFFIFFLLHTGMDIFFGKFYEPTEEETGIKEYHKKMKEKKDKLNYINRYLEANIAKIPFIPIKDES